MFIFGWDTLVMSLPSTIQNHHESSSARLSFLHVSCMRYRLERSQSENEQLQAESVTRANLPQCMLGSKGMAYTGWLILGDLQLLHTPRLLLFTSDMSALFYGCVE
jgi:hypothetical protein